MARAWFVNAAHESTTLFNTINNDRHNSRDLGILGGGRQGSGRLAWRQPDAEAVA